VAIPIYPILLLQIVDAVRCRKSLTVIRQVHQYRMADLTGVVEACDAIGPLTSLREDRQQQRSQEGDDGYDHQKSPGSASLNGRGTAPLPATARI